MGTNRACIDFRPNIVAQLHRAACGTDQPWIEADIASAGYNDGALSLIQIHRIPLGMLGAVRNAACGIQPRSGSLT